MMMPDEQQSYMEAINRLIIRGLGGTDEANYSNCTQVQSENASLDQQEYVEVTLDVHEDTIRVHSVAPAPANPRSPADGEIEDQNQVWWNNGARSLNSFFRRNASARPMTARLSSPRLKGFSLNNIFAQSRMLFAPGNRNSSRAGVSNGAAEWRPWQRQRQRQRPPWLERSKSSACVALRRLRFITNATDNASRKRLWQEMEIRFHKLACPEGFLSRNDFAECIGMEDSKEFVLELFDALCRRTGRCQAERISKEELREYYLELIDESFDNRLQLFFQMFDTDVDGRITEDEVKEVIMVSASANRLSILKDRAAEYATLIMEELDPDNFGYIEAWQLESLLLQGSSYGRNQSRNQSQSLKNSRALSPHVGGADLPMRYCFAVRFLRGIMLFLVSDWRRIWILFLWTILMIILFAWKFIEYKNKTAFQVMGYCLCVSKGAAETLKLNMAIILLPVCRNTITWLRNTRLRSVIPFDDNLNFHKIIATAILVAVIIHASVHLTCDFPRIINCPDEQFNLIRKDFGGQRPSYNFFLTSVEGITGIIMVVLMIAAFTLATHWFRRNLLKLPKPFHKITGFNTFWYSHHMFIIVYVCLVIHGVCLFFAHEFHQKTTWMYLSVPVVLYLGERTLRAFRSGYRGVDILNVVQYPCNVLSLHLSKPQGFKYKSGQYMFLKCPAVSPFEWHPFSITSAPADSYLSVHIRGAGDWTQELTRVFAQCCSSAAAGKGVDGYNELEKRPPAVLIDGPYGAPAQHYKKYEVLLLIGLGIGATPFVSILKDVKNNMKLTELEGSSSDKKLGGIPMSKRGDHQPFLPTRAYFYWVTREQSSFEWFKQVMNEIVDYDQKGVIELHNYLTSVYEEGDARSALIVMLQALNQAKNGVDILSGTRVGTHLGRPNWRQIFSKVAAAHKGAKIGVFYCGSPLLAPELHALTQEYNRKYSVTYGTRFDFHKENF